MKENRSEHIFPEFRKSELSLYETNEETQNRYWNSVDESILEINLIVQQLIRENPRFNFIDREVFFQHVKDNRLAVEDSNRTLKELAKEYGLSNFAFVGMLEKGTILDVGSGKSTLSADLKEKKVSSKVTSVDLSLENLKQLKVNGEVVVGDATELPFDATSFDTVMASYSLPVWSSSPKEVRASINEYLRVVKPSGSVHVAPIQGFGFRKPINAEGQMVGRPILFKGEIRIIESDPAVIYALEQNELEMLKLLQELRENNQYSTILLSSEVSSGDDQPMSVHIKKLM